MQSYTTANFTIKLLSITYMQTLTPMLSDLKHVHVRTCTMYL